MSGWMLPGYTEVQRLGEGAYGRVVLARHDGSGQLVAIKYLFDRHLVDDTARAQFRHEAALLRLVASPHVARLHEFVESEQGAAIVMEAVPGVSLRLILRAYDTVAPESALTVLKGSLLGLHAAHLAGAVHRDYKPANVLVQPDQQSKLVDFGLAMLAGQTGQPGGTPAYMAPEQWAGAPATPATDVYAATCVLFHCLTGQRPFDSTDLDHLRHLHQHAPVPLDQVAEPLRPLLAHGMAKDPAVRPHNAEAFVTELERAAHTAFGRDWEATGWQRLATAAGTLLAASPLAWLAGTTSAAGAIGGALGGTSAAATGGTALGGTAVTGTAAAGGTALGGTATAGSTAAGGAGLGGTAVTGAAAGGGTTLGGTAVTGATAGGGTTLGETAAAGTATGGGTALGGTAAAGSAAGGGTTLGGTAVTGATAGGGTALGETAAAGTATGGGTALGGTAAAGSAAGGGTALGGTAVTGAAAGGGSALGGTAVGGTTAAAVGKTVSAAVVGKIVAAVVGAAVVIGGTVVVIDQTTGDDPPAAPPSSTGQAAAVQASVAQRTESFDTFTFDGQYARVSGLADAAVQDRVNAALMAPLDDWIDKTRGGTVEPEPSGNLAAAHTEAEIRMPGPKIISVRYTQSIDSVMFGNRGGYAETVVNVDLTTGRELSVTDVFPDTDTESGMSELAGRIRTAHPDGWCGGEDTADGAPWQLEPDDLDYTTAAGASGVQLAFTPDGVELVVYSDAIGYLAACGYGTLAMPYDAVADLMAPDVAALVTG
jgi:protein kinase-like protein